MLTRKDLNEGLGKQVKVYFKDNTAISGLLHYEGEDPEHALYYFLLNGEWWISRNFVPEDVVEIDIYSLEQKIWDRNKGE